MKIVNTDQINKVKMKVFKDVNKFRSRIDEIIKNKIRYIHFGVLAVSAILALLLGSVLLGYIRGFCSKPGSLQAEAAATLIRVSFQFFFILAAVLFAFCAALLLVGGISEKAVCNSLRTPEDSQVIELADNYLQDTYFNDLYNGTFNLSIVDVIHGIHNNTPLYPLLHPHQHDDKNSKKY